MGRVISDCFTATGHHIVASHSLFRQGCMLYELIPNMPEHRLTPLVAAFAKAVSGASEFSGLFAQPE